MKWAVVVQDIWGYIGMGNRKEDADSEKGGSGYPKLAVEART